MIDLYFYDREGNPIPGKVPTSLRVVGGTLSRSAFDACQNAFTQFSTAYRLGLYESLVQNVVIDPYTTLVLQVNHGVFTAVATVSPQGDDAEDFCGGIVVQLARVTDPAYWNNPRAFTSPTARGPALYPSDLITLLPEQSRGSGSPTRTVHGALGDRDDTNAPPTDTFIFQIAAEGDLSRVPIARGLVKIFRIRSPVIGALTSHVADDVVFDLRDSLRTGKYIPSATVISQPSDQQKVTGFAYCGQPMPVPDLELPAFSLPIADDQALRAARLYTFALNTTTFVDASVAQFIWVVAAPTGVFAFNMQEPGEGWQTLASYVITGAYRYFGYDFQVTNDGRSVACWGEDEFGALSGFTLSFSESAGGTWSVSAELRIEDFPDPAPAASPTLNQTSSWTNTRSTSSLGSVPRYEIDTEFVYPNYPDPEPAVLTLTGGPRTIGAVEVIEQTWRNTYANSVAFTSQIMERHDDPFTGLRTMLYPSYQYNSTGSFDSGDPTQVQVGWVSSLAYVSVGTQAKFEGTDCLLSQSPGSAGLFANDATFSSRMWLVFPAYGQEWSQTAGAVMTMQYQGYPFLGDVAFTVTVNSTIDVAFTATPQTIEASGAYGFTTTGPIAASGPGGDYFEWTFATNVAVGGPNSGPLTIPAIYQHRAYHPGSQPVDNPGYPGDVAYDLHSFRRAMRTTFDRTGSWQRIEGAVVATFTANWNEAEQGVFNVDRNEVAALRADTGEAYQFDVMATFPGAYQGGPYSNQFALPNAINKEYEDFPPADIYPTARWWWHGPLARWPSFGFRGFFPFAAHMVAGGFWADFTPGLGYQGTPFGNDQVFSDGAGNDCGPGRSAQIFALDSSPVPQNDADNGTFSAAINLNGTYADYTVSQYELLGDLSVPEIAEWDGAIPVLSYNEPAVSASNFPGSMRPPQPDTQIVNAVLWRDPRNGGYVHEVFAEARLNGAAGPVRCASELMVGNLDGCVPLVDVLNEWLELEGSPPYEARDVILTSNQKVSLI